MMSRTRSKAIFSTGLGLAVLLCVGMVSRRTGGEAEPVQASKNPQVIVDLPKLWSKSRAEVLKSVKGETIRTWPNSVVLRLPKTHSVTFVFASDKLASVDVVFDSQDWNWQKALVSMNLDPKPVTAEKRPPSAYSTWMFAEVHQLRGVTGLDKKLSLATFKRFSSDREALGRFQGDDDRADRYALELVSPPLGP